MLILLTKTFSLTVLVVLFVSFFIPRPFTPNPASSLFIGLIRRVKSKKNFLASWQGEEIASEREREKEKEKERERERAREDVKGFLKCA